MWNIVATSALLYANSGEMFLADFLTKLRQLMANVRATTILSWIALLWFSQKMKYIAHILIYRVLSEFLLRSSESNRNLTVCKQIHIAVHALRIYFDMYRRKSPNEWVRIARVVQALNIRTCQKPHFWKTLQIDGCNEKNYLLKDLHVERRNLEWY